MSHSPSPHMVLALQAGVVSQELLDALTAVDDKLSSACLFAEYWDTHLDRDAWLQQHLPPQLHSLAVPLHQWCCEHSASWARGAVHIPVFSSPPSLQPIAPSTSTTTSVTGSKRRYAAITSGGRHRRQTSSSLPPDGPLLSKAAREQEEYHRFWRSLSILIHRWANYLDSFKTSARPLCVRRSKSLAFAKSFLQPRHQPARFEHTICLLSGSCCGVLTGNCHRASVSYQYRRCRFHGEVGAPRLFGAKIHCIEFGLVGQTLRCAFFIFFHSKCHHG